MMSNLLFYVNYFNIYSRKKKFLKKRYFGLYSPGYRLKLKIG